ncbi:MAG: FHA domain-containing protein [Deltaproteobacteria bacterium]|jgi:predicted component of type VI protein secretion system|nr:FHA domain-containing protein [Deltaproteobacteria bacterium]
MGAEKRQKLTSYLVLQTGTGEKQAIVWDTLDISVGRNDSQDIVVADPEVSRKHAVFRRRGEACVLEDLNTGLGTLVDGRPIKEHALQHGNTIQIGTLRIEFGQVAKPLARGKNVRFASELKEFGLSALEDAAGRTMLGFDTEDDLLTSASASSSAAPRAVTADGTVEIDETGSGTLDLAPDVAVRNLDLDLARDIPPLDESAIANELAITRPTQPALERSETRGGKAASAAPLDPIASEAVDTSPKANVPQITAKLVLEIKGPAKQVEALLEAIRDKRIQIPPIELLVRDL